MFLHIIISSGFVWINNISFTTDSKTIANEARKTVFPAQNLGMPKFCIRIHSSNSYVKSILVHGLLSHVSRLTSWVIVNKCIFQGSIVSKVTRNRPIDKPALLHLPWRRRSGTAAPLILPQTVPLLKNPASMSPRSTQQQCRHGSTTIARLKKQLESSRGIHLPKVFPWRLSYRSTLHTSPSRKSWYRLWYRHITWCYGAIVYCEGAAWRW